MMNGRLPRPAPNQDIRILPYSELVGQHALKLALELAYIAPGIGGVLISGQRGTGKSTAVRGFARMMYNDLPVTIPINATEDRVVGGWQVDALLRGKPEPQPGLLVEADGKILYVDEVNLLDDHIVNMILDASSTGVLVVEREAQRDRRRVSFTLVGTMNPEEGFLRPQLLDRFGLMVNVQTEPAERIRILEAVLRFDAAGRRTETADNEADHNLHTLLTSARARLHRVSVPETVLKACVTLTSAFGAEGHRADYVMALAARALAAREGKKAATLDHIIHIAALVLRHRRPEVQEVGRDVWTAEDQQKVEHLLANG